MINSVFRTSSNYYSQVFLEECKYVVKEKKVSQYVIEEISPDTDRGDSDEQNSDEENLKNTNITYNWYKKLTRIFFIDLLSLTFYIYILYISIYIYIYIYISSESSGLPKFWILPKL